MIGAYRYCVEFKIKGERFYLHAIDTSNFIVPEAENIEFSFLRDPLAPSEVERVAFLEAIKDYPDLNRKFINARARIYYLLSNKKRKIGSYSKKGMKK